MTLSDTLATTFDEDFNALDVFAKLYLGTPTRPGRVLLVDSATHLDALLDPSMGWVAPTAIVVSPEAHHDLRVLTVTRSPGDDEITAANGDSLALTEYEVASYLPVVGPTVVGVLSETDLDVLIADADHARASGVFPQALLHPLVALSSTCVLGYGQCPSQQLDSLFVNEAGEVRCAHRGANLGWVFEGFDAAIEAAGEVDCAQRCLGEAVDRERLMTLRSDRPWLGLYIAVLTVLRNRQLDPLSCTIDGFGNETATHRYDGEITMITSGLDNYLVGRNGHSFRVGADGSDYLRLRLAYGSAAAARSAFADAHNTATERLESVMAPLDSAFDALTINAGEDT